MQNLPKVLKSNRLKTSILSLLIVLLSFSTVSAAEGGESGTFDPGELINHHIADAHSWEIVHGVSVYLPVIVYSEERGVDVFSSKNFFSVALIFPSFTSILS